MRQYKKPGKMMALLVAATLLILPGCNKKEPDAVTTDKNIPVSVRIAAKENISTSTSISGKVTPLHEVVIIPKIPGKAAQVPVDVGVRVKKGTLLAKLDTTDLEISLSSALNGLQNARLTQDQARLNYNNAKSNYDRMKALYKDGAISLQQLEQAELSFNLAKDALKAPAVASAQNQIDSIRNQISNATITSPIDGEIAMRNIDPGEMAGTTQPIMTVVNIDTVYIEGTVAEADIPLVTQGQKVSVKVDAAGGTFEGIVKTVSPVANPQTKGYPVKVEVNNPGHKLKPGMFAEIKLVTKERKDVVVIPKEALVNRGSAKALYVVDNNVAQERTVELGVESDEKVEVVKGLQAGETFVISGQQSLSDKVKVTVQTTNTGN